MTDKGTGDEERQSNTSRTPSTPPRHDKSPRRRVSSPSAQLTGSVSLAADGSDADSKAEVATAPNDDSEAETEVLSGTPAKKRDAERRATSVKKESEEEEEDITAIKQHSSSARQTKRASVAEGAVAGRKKTNGVEQAAKAGENGRKQSSSMSPGQPLESSNDAHPSSRESSQKPLAKTSDGEDDVDGPTSRKRKRPISAKPSNGEPPRQKQKAILPTKDEAQSREPSGNVPNKLHKRSQSSQSVPSNGKSRKGRERAASVQNSAWDSDSSDSIDDDNASYQFAKGALPRSGPSPVRSVPHTKKKVDRFGVSVFARLCEKGDLEGAKAILEQSPEDIDGGDYAKNTPLQKACLEGQLEVVEFLISTGRCNINNANSSHDTPLIDAVENGHVDVVELLLKAGADPHLQNNKGNKPIDVVDIEDDHADELRALLNDAMQQYNSTKRQASGASESQQVSPALPKSPSIASALFGRQAKLPNSILHMESTIETLRTKAAEGDQLAVYELLVRGVRPDNACGVAAARGGHEFILNLFIDNGLDVDPDPVKHDYVTPMLASIGRGHQDIVDLLLKQDGFDPTRVDRDGRLYYQLAEHRVGPNWEKERDMLKEAYENHLKRRQSPKKKQGASKNTSPDVAQKKSTGERVRKAVPEGQNLGNEDGDSKAETKERKRKHSKTIENKAWPGSQIDRSADEEFNAAHPEAPERKRKLVQAKDLANSGRRSHGSAEVAGSEYEKSERRGKSKTPASSRQSTPDGLAKSKDGGKSSIKSESSLKKTVAEGDLASSNLKSGTGNQEKPNKHRPDSIRRQKTEEDARSQRERKDGEKSVRDKTQRDKIEQQSLQNEKVEQEKRALQQAKEKQRLAKEKRERERIETEKAEQERLEREKKEREREEREKAEKEKLEKEKLERERLEQERLERERLEKERLDKERMEKEKAERERVERERKAEERRAMLDTLPRALRLAMELGPNIRPNPKNKEMSLKTHFLPIELVALIEIDPGCNPDEAQSLWLPNFQAAPLLGHEDLTLSIYSSWERRPLSVEHRKDLLRMYDIAKLALPYQKPWMDDPAYDPTALVSLVKEAKAKFLALEPLFWIRLDSFIDATPEYPHLKDFVIKTRAVCHVDYVDDPEYGRVRRGFADRMKAAEGDPVKASEMKVEPSAPKALEFVNGKPKLENGY